MTIDVKALMSDGEFFGRVVAGGGTIDGVDIPALTDGDRIVTVPDVGANTVEANVVLSTGLSGGDTLAGGVGAAEDLTLASTTHATRGDLKLRDQVLLLSENKTNTNTSTEGAFYALKANPTLTMSGTTTGQVLNMVDISPSVDWTANPNSLVTHSYVQVKPAVSHNAATRTMNTHLMFSSAPTYTGTTNTMTLSSHICFSASPTITGTVTGTAIVGFSAGLTVGSGSTCTAYTGVLVQTPALTGTLTASTGLSIAALGGTTPIGINVAEPMVHPPKNVVLAATTAIPIDRAVVRLTPTAEVTWGPTVDSPADGTNGQMLTLVNTSVYNINLQNTTLDAESRFVFSSQSTNRFVLLPSCAVTFVYSTTVDKWCQVGGSPTILAYAHGSLGTSSAIDTTKGDYQTCTTTTAHTLTAANVGVAGDNLTLLITNDATTGRVITFGTGFQSTGTLTGTLSKKAQVTFRSNGTSWYEVSRSLAMT